MAIYTIGYGNRKFSNFIPLLKQNNIKYVVDVRRFPKSSSSEYNRENLEISLPEFGINYVFMGEALGGLRRGGYPRHMQTDLYKDGINRLLDLAEEGNVVLMCKERSDSGCHRRYIVETLKNLNKDTISIVWPSLKDVSLAIFKGV